MYFNLCYLLLILTQIFTPTLSTTAQVSCPIGKYLNGSHCIFCSPGTYNDIVGATSCKPCPSGTFNPFHGSQGIDICQKCPENTFSNTRSTACTACPPGSNSRTGASKCLSCGPGLFLLKKRSSGEFSLTDGEQVCVKCPGGYYSSKKSNTDCTPCPPDFSSSSGSTGISSCFRCPPGTDSSRTFSVDSASFVDNDCYQCSPSSFKPVRGTICRECPPGFSTSTIGKTRCDPCPSGTFVDRETRPGVSVNAQCMPCPSGMVAPGRGNAICRKKNDKDCPKGFFKAGDNSCRKCGPGWRYDRRRNKCIMCSEKRVSEGGLSERCKRCRLSSTPNREFGRFDKCICLENFYIDKLGKCSKCPAGKQPSYKDDEGKQTCLRCGFDSFSAERGMLCEKCPPGTIQDRNQRGCTRCPNGTFPNPEPFLAPGPRCLSGQNGCPIYTRRVVNDQGKFVGCKRRTCPSGTFREAVNMNLVFNRKSFGGCRACEPGSRFTGNSCEWCDRLSRSDGGLDRKCVPCGEGRMQDSFDRSKCRRTKLSPYELMLSSRG